MRRLSLHTHEQGREPTAVGMRWISGGAAAVALALVPKCVFCVLAYLSLLGGSGIELCGASPADRPVIWWRLLVITAVFAGLWLLRGSRSGTRSAREIPNSNSQAANWKS